MNNWQEVNFKGWKINVDKELTQNTYAQVKLGSAEESESIEGVNYFKQRDKVFPKEVLTLFEALGIDYKKETEVSHHEELENGLHQYFGWFHYKGSFEGENCLQNAEDENKIIELTTLTKTFKIGFRNANFLTAFDDRKNIVQIEYECILPWVLDVEYEGELELED